ncbi:hypothetical protein [Prochlorococcus sp. ALOHA_ZT_50]|uniref:hypothetical protein n=1 Tax=Prochlorococcus sp. ALOHA_ZT_50 TaxID=2919303 RepID=UPI0025801C8D|nr:hypothetical protein [Prochlorococcus sp. ALOHA_ZT_50]MCH2079630.1 hypothetical protein [Prochlorococcus sp. ALOHA_ZT_50]
MKKKVINPEHMQVLYSNCLWFTRAFGISFEELIRQLKKNHKRLEAKHDQERQK